MKQNKQPFWTEDDIEARSFDIYECNIPVRAFPTQGHRVLMPTHRLRFLYRRRTEYNHMHRATVCERDPLQVTCRNGQDRSQSCPKPKSLSQSVQSPFGNFGCARAVVCRFSADKSESMSGLLPLRRYISSPWYSVKISDFNGNCPVKVRTG